MSASSGKKTFMQGAVILGVAGILVKILGGIFRIPLTNILLDSGVGYYTAAYPIYVMFLTLSTAGLPVAISRLVAEANALNNPREGHRIFKISFILMFIIGAVSSAVLFFGANEIAELLSKGGNGIEYSLMAIAPALFFVPLMAAYRGYFQGMQNMAPTAVSQVIEQFFRVAVGLFLAIALMPVATELLQGYSADLAAVGGVDLVPETKLIFGLIPRDVRFAAAGASFGATAGAVFGLIGIIIIYQMNKKRIMDNMKNAARRKSASVGSILGKIFVIAVPITIGAAIMPIINTIDSFTVMNRLQSIGFSKETALTMYGQLTGIATSLINLPQVLTQAVAMSLVPVVASSFKKGDMPFVRHNIELSLRLSTIIGMPCSFGLVVMSEPIMKLLYRASEASAISQAQCLFVLGMGVIFLASVQITAGILQGVGKQNIPVRNLFIGALVKLAMTYTLVTVPGIYVRGAAMGTVAAYVIASSLNLLAVKKYTGIRFNVRQIWLKPLVSSAAMGLAAFCVHRLTLGFLGNTLATACAIGVAVIVYVVMIFATGTITEEELRLVPKGDKLVKITKRFQR